MENLRALGLVDVLRNDVARAGKPFLGICIGIQVLFDRSEEDAAECLGIVAGRVARYPSSRSTAARSKFRKSDGTACARREPIRVFAGVPDNTHFYFVNSYYPIPDDPVARDWRMRLRPAVHRRDRARQRHRHAIPSRKERHGRPQAARQLLPDERLTMLAKRIIPCLDVRDGKVTKGVQFLANVDVGDPVAMARYYYNEGADEIVFYDITASNERRGIMLDVVRAVAREIFIPFSVGGGLRTLDDMRAVLLAGAEKVSIDSGAVRNPAADLRGRARLRQPVCRALDAGRKKPARAPRFPTGYEVVIDGGRQPTGRDALAWSLEGERLGAGELCINSIDRDGTKLGYDLEITRRISEAVSIPVIASGGAGEPSHLRDAFTAGMADAAIVASIVHYGEHPIPALKSYLKSNGVEIRDAVTVDL